LRLTLATVEGIPYPVNGMALKADDANVYARLIPVQEVKTWPLMRRPALY
jgi:hypothetical protein